MIRILYYSIFLDNGGVERMFYEWISNLNSEYIHVDILTEKILSEGIKEKIENLGCKIFRIPYLRYPSRRKRKILEEFLRTNDYNIVHAHIMVTFHSDVLRAAKKVGIPVRIAHSHNIVSSKAKLTTKILHRIYRPVLLHNATDFFACGKSAGESLFGSKHKYIVIKNGIDLNKFSFENSKRIQIRNELNLNNKELLIGSVGRLSIQKNYSFLLPVFGRIIKKNLNCRLLLVGEGEELEKLKKQAQDLSIEDHVIFYGNSNDVPGMMSAMDVFVLPSLFEGFTLVLLEAQAMGLPCVASNKIPTEVNLTETVNFLSLEESIETWCNTILKEGVMKRRYDNHNILYDKGYDIGQTSLLLKKWYELRCKQ